MRWRFTKMHGLGNDFVVFDARQMGGTTLAPHQIRHVASRNTGVGCDQVLVVRAPETATASISYEVFNADGDGAEQCGNGARCLALFARPDASPGDQTVLDGPTGPVCARFERDGLIGVNIGTPDFDPAAADFTGTRAHFEFEGKDLEFGIVSLGNPHAVFFVPSAADAPVAELGAALQASGLFREGVNVSFAEVKGDDSIRLRVFERGAGETQACGTGACAAAVVARQRGLVAENTSVTLPGGELLVSWPGPGQNVWLTGPATKVFEATIDL